ncbi:MAG: cell division protein ZapA [Gammaproteobacteria bacterium]|nr:cell division protein ZapA [Gammaproteobacteria bacterium]
MKAMNDGVKVSIMGREYSVACADDQQAALTQAAIHLDRRMREIQKGGKVIGMERCAIMAALNITHELLELKNIDNRSNDMESRVRALYEKIDLAMRDDEQKQLTL